MARLASENNDVRHHPIAPRDVIESLRMPVVRQCPVVRPLVAQVAGRQIAHAGGGFHLGVDLSVIYVKASGMSHARQSAFLNKRRHKHSCLPLNLLAPDSHASVGSLCAPGFGFYIHAPDSHSWLRFALGANLNQRPLAQVSLWLTFLCEPPWVLIKNPLAYGIISV